MSIRLEALPEFTAAMRELERRANAEGIFFKTADHGGTRTQADTTLILRYRDADYGIYAAKERAAGRTPRPINEWRPIQPYGNSFHNYGAARDILITAKPSGMSASQALDRVAQLAAGVGLRRPLPQNDPGHIELAVTLNDARARWGNYVDAGGASSSSSGTPTLATLGWLLLIGVGFAIAKRFQ